MLGDARGHSYTGEVRNPSSNASEIGALLSVLLASSGPFIVLRNSEQLPFALSGSDIDVTLRSGEKLDEAAKWVRAEATRLGWSYGFENFRSYMYAVGLFRDCGSEFEAVHLDVFDGITALGVPAISTTVLENEIRIQRGISVLSPRGEALATLVHHLVWSGGLGKEKYRAQLQQLLDSPDSRSWFIKHVRSSLGPRLAAEIVDIENLKKGFRRRRIGALAHVIRRHSLLDRKAVLLSVSKYVRSQIATTIKPTGMVARRGDPIPGSKSVFLSLELACQLEPHSIYARHVRVSSSSIRNTNGPAYETFLRKKWRRSAPLRWILPSLFVWFQTKRGEIVLLDSLPLGVRILKRAREILKFVIP